MAGKTSAGMPASDRMDAPRADRGTVAAQAGLAAFLILIAGFFALLPVLDTPLHGEDLELMIESDALHRLVTTPQAHDRLPYAPLTLYVLAANWMVAPFNAAFLRAVSLLLHLANGVLIFLLCRKLLDGKLPDAVSMLAGMLFVVHPGVLESVQSLHGRPAVQGLFFVLLGLWCYLRAARVASVDYILLSIVAICQTLAFASYAPAWVMPLLLIAIDQCRGRLAALKKIHIAFGGIAIALAAAQLAAGIPWAFFAGEAPGVLWVNSVLLMDVLFSLGTQSSYALRLHAFDIVNGYSFNDALIDVILSTFYLAIAIWLVFRRSLAGVALVWTMATIAATAIILPASHVSAAGLYLPLAGLALLVPWLCLPLQQAGLRAALGCLMAGLALVAGGVTHQRAAAGRDPAALWAQRAEAGHPFDPVPYMHLGRYLMNVAPALEDGEREAALLRAADAFRNALGLLTELRIENEFPELLARRPDEGEVMARLGTALYEAGRPGEALPVLLDALRRRPLDRDTTLRVAVILAQKAQENPEPEQLRNAADYIRRAQRLGAIPEDTAGLFGVTLAGLGDFEAALPLLQQTVADDAESPWAAAARQVQMLAEQTRALERAVEEKLKQSPGDLGAVLMQAEAQAMRGHWLSASYILDAVLRKSPENKQAWMLLGVGRARMNAATGFLAEWRDAPAADGDAWHGLALRCAGSGLWEAALEYLKVAPARSGDPASAVIRLADIAMELKQPQRAAQYLELAAKERPEDPEPWLRLCDMAIAAGHLARARQYLEEAEKRHAYPEELEKRRAQLGETPERPGQPVRTIIR